MVLRFGAHTLWASWGLGWVLGNLHSVISTGKCAPSFPAPKSRFFKALLEPSLFAGWGQTACAGFWAQKDRQVRVQRLSALHGFFGPATLLLSSLLQATLKLCSVSRWIVPQICTCAGPRAPGGFPGLVTQGNDRSSLLNHPLSFFLY